ncbi:unnamed protein product [Nesidiocoris tenuis]|uniref:Uncharacterized protein n=1 Tax=Nesidiocoris tenuis TaxID=355587 RepID=A0A6H5GCN0_9HEMI|nr:unnamed protein product [Nesidiocoris tenuis]
MESRGDTASINSTGSSTSTGRPPSLGSTSRRSTIPSASIMRHYVLRAVSSQLQAANISLERSGRISCHGLQSVSLSYSLISCLWLTSRTVALIDTNETLHLLDVRSKQELESLDLSMIEIVYNSAAFKGLATGGNVSKAMDKISFLAAIEAAILDGKLTDVPPEIMQRLVSYQESCSKWNCNEVSWVLCTLNSSAVGRGLRVDPELYVESLHRLTTEDDQCSHAERQSAFLQLLTSGSLNELAHDTLLQLAKSAMFHQVCAVLYEMRGEYVEVVKCHLLDPTRRPYIFSYIEQAHPSAVLSILLPDVLQDNVRY